MPEITGVENGLPEPMDVPPEAAVYQFAVAPVETLTCKFTEPIPHLVAPKDEFTTGASGVIVIVEVGEPGIGVPLQLTTQRKSVLTVTEP